MSGLIKVAVIGGGSTYTPELVEGFIESYPEFPIQHLTLMDIDERKLGIVGGLAKRMVKASGLDIQVELTTQRDKAIEGTVFVISQIRVGQMPARILDEKIPPQFGVIGQETTGPGGFAKALRTIPVILEIAHEMERLAPRAMLINFTNPAGLITEALQAYSTVNSIGLCNSPIGAEMRLAQSFSVERKRISLDWIGLNHLNWIRGVQVDGKDVWEQVLRMEIEEARRNPDEHWGFSAELLETLGLIPNGYLNYFYNHDRILEEQKIAAKTRGEEVSEIEEALLEMYRDEKLREKPKLLEKRGGAFYSKAAVSLIAAIWKDKKETHIVNTLNRGAVPDLPEDCVVEVPASIGADGARPLATRPVPLAVRGTVEAIKAYEKLTVQAAVTGDMKLAVQALLAHPLVPGFDAARKLVTALLEAHRQHLPQFFPRG